MYGQSKYPWSQDRAHARVYPPGLGETIPVFLAANPRDAPYACEDPRLRAQFSFAVPPWCPMNCLPFAEPYYRPEDHPPLLYLIIAQWTVSSLLCHISAPLDVNPCCATIPLWGSSPLIASYWHSVDFSPVLWYIVAPWTISLCCVLLPLLLYAQIPQ